MTVLLLSHWCAAQGEAGEGDALSEQAIADLQRECRVYCDSMDPQATLNIGIAWCLYSLCVAL